MTTMLPPIIGDFPTWIEKWIDKIIGGLGAVALAVIGVRLQRSNEREKDARQRRELGEAGNATVEVEHIQGLHRALERLEAENKTLRDDGERAGRKYDEMRSVLEWKLTSLTTAYYELHRLAINAAPKLELGSLEPFTLITSLNQPVNISIFTPPAAGEKKVTAVIKTITVPTDK